MASNSRVWFITGTSSGLGNALLEVVLAAGERAVATLRKPEVLSSFKEKYPDSQLLLVSLDVTIPSQITAAFEAAKNHFGRVDVVVNNAGYAVLGEIEVIPDDEARREFEVQFWGPVNITREAIRFFREVNPPGHGGRIFNISTGGGYIGFQAMPFYCASKFGEYVVETSSISSQPAYSALEGFTESFIKEMLPEWNIKGCIIQPGGVDTEWRKGSMVVFPPHPAYADPSSPSSQMRKMLGSVTFQLDAHKMGKAILSLADEPTLPLRIQLGGQSTALIKTKAQSVIDDADKWTALSHSTHKDGVDGEAYLKNIAVAAKAAGAK